MTSQTSLVSAVRQFGESTSLHGVGRVLSPALRNNRFYWKNSLYLLALIGGVTFASWSIITVIADFRDYPVTSHVELVYPGEMEFPAVTICNADNLGVMQGEHLGPELNLTLRHWQFC